MTKEDQDKINAFSRLHNRERLLEEDLQTKQVRAAYNMLFHTFNSGGIPLLDSFMLLTKRPHHQKDKEDLEEVSTELELADEDDLIP